MNEIFTGFFCLLYLLGILCGGRAARLFKEFAVLGLHVDNAVVIIVELLPEPIRNDYDFSFLVPFYADIFALDFRDDDMRIVLADREIRKIKLGKRFCFAELVVGAPERRKVGSCLLRLAFGIGTGFFRGVELLLQVGDFLCLGISRFFRVSACCG